MRYKCIKSYGQYDVQLMEIGDIIVLGDNKLYNLTKNVEYSNIYNMDECKQCLEAFDDDSSYIASNPSDSFLAITKTMAETFAKKNHDYGNSFEQSLDEEGLAAARIRMGDKWNRFKNLSKGVDSQVNDESLIDTLLDLANYSIMTVMWLNKQK